MALKSSAQITADLASWLTNELLAKIDNSAPLIYPNIHQTVLNVLEVSIQDIVDSYFNKVTGIAQSDVTGLVSALAGKEPADSTILKEGEVVNNLVSVDTNLPLSAYQGKILKDLIDALPAINSALSLDQGGANQVTAAELRAHLDNSLIHFLQSEINHNNILNKGTNTHAQIDSHIADSTKHFTVASIDHTLISNVGSNTHTQIDSHISSTVNPHSVTIKQAVQQGGLTVNKGSIYAGNASTIQELGIGSDGQVLKANSAQPTGLEWSDDIGEVNIAQVLGGGVSMYVGKSGSTLQFRSLTTANGLLSITNVGNNTQFTINEASIDHQNITGVGANTHAQIDSHIANVSNPHGVTITQVSPTTTKGDLIADNGGSSVRFGVGTNGQTLVADSTQSTGLRWSSDLVTAIAHTTSTSNPHGTTITQSVDAEGLPKVKGTVYVADGSSIITLGVGTDGQALVANSATASGLSWSSSLGEINTASNLAATGVGVFDTKSGVDLRFRRIDASNSQVTVVQNGSKIDIGIVPANISHQTLSGTGANTHTDIDNHIANISNPHSVTKTQVGLANVPNVNATDCDNHTDGATNGVLTLTERTRLAGITTGQAALTASLTSLTQTGVFTPDYAIQAMINASAWGFASQDEAETVLSVILNLQTRVNQIEARLQTSDIIL